MYLTEENYVNAINSYDRGHWQPLLDLIPVIESTYQFEMIEDSENDIFAPISTTKIVMDFLKLVDELGLIVAFDWPHWDEGKAIVNDDGFDFDLIDIPTKCKLITAIIRNDRFFDGVLDSAFESGLILKILQSIDRQLMDS